MYSALSQSCKQGLLFLTDLPHGYGYNLSYINYQLTYSDSYSGLLNSALPIISDFPYVISLLATVAAFDSLHMDNYHAYMLTLELCTVAIYCLPNGKCKIFYSHGRDLLGRGPICNMYFN